VTKTIELGIPERLTLHQEWPNGAPESTETGQEFVQKLAIMGMPADVSWRVEQHEAPTLMVLRGAGPLGAELATTISTQANGSSTQLSYEAEFSGGGIQGPMGEMVTQKAGEEIETSLLALKALVA
jgi:hypothetical protein